MSRLLKTELVIPAAAPADATIWDLDLLVEDISAWLSSNSLQGWEEISSPATGDVTLRFYLEPESPLAGVITELVAVRWPGVRLATESMEQQDWSAAWREFFTPISIGGRFEILPPWLKDNDCHGREPILIEPKMAFGTGHHATTALCLGGIADMVSSGRLTAASHFLDLGTGSGILAIGLAKLGCSGIAADIDPQAVFCAAENLELNKLPASGAPGAPVKLVVGGLETLGKDVTFDCIVANILAQPLIDMAAAILAHLKPGGTLTLSGLLTHQAAAVAKAYTDRGMPEPVRKDEGEWSGLFWM